MHVPLFPKYPYVAEVALPSRGRLIAIGDVHGCLDEFLGLLVRLKLGPYDYVVPVGDYTDRGPKSAQTLEVMRSLQSQNLNSAVGAMFYMLPGNHDEKHVRRRHHDLRAAADPTYRNRMAPLEEPRKSEYAAMPDETLAWMAGLPQAYLFRTARGDRIACHSGLLPKKEWWKQDAKAFIRNRSVAPRPDGSWMPAPDVKVDGHYAQAPGAQMWDEVWPQSGVPATTRVLYGHIVHNLRDPHVLNGCYGLDTGCCFGGVLTGYVEDLSTGDVHFEQIDAITTYHPDRDAVE